MMERLHSARRLGTFVVVTAALAFALEQPASAILYEGRPDLALTSALVAAGGGPEHFSSQKVFALLTGAQAGAEGAKLTKQFGAAQVANAFAVFDYAVDDAVRVAVASHIALPSPSPDPADPKALALALYAAGTSGSGKWDVGYMLEHLMSHGIHHTIMQDMDAKFGAANNASFHVVLTQIMSDLAKVYAGSPSAAAPAH